MSTSQNRQALADMTKQFLLITVSLSLTSAFVVFTPAKGTAGEDLTILYLLHTVTIKQYFDYIMFFAYILICVKYLLVHWLYLSKLYPAGSLSGGENASSSVSIEDASQTHKRRHMLWEVFVVLFTGIVLGVQGFYVGKILLPLFSLLFSFILLFDVIGSLLSLHRDRGVPKPVAEKIDILYSTTNDAFFCLVCFAVLIWGDLGNRSKPSDLSRVLLFLSVFANCVLSLLITAQSYFVDRQNRWDRCLGIT
jgi:hypothetical protein